MEQIGSLRELAVDLNVEQWDNARDKVVWCAGRPDVSGDPLCQWVSAQVGDGHSPCQPVVFQGVWTVRHSGDHCQIGVFDVLEAEIVLMESVFVWIVGIVWFEKHVEAFVNRRAVDGVIHACDQACK